jgi:cyclopropane fatty-acyl-phospholipid synthase-like methyltransferase
VLDIGCGSGIPVARFLVNHGFEVTGIDVSPKQIELARTNVPEARFEIRDMRGLSRAEYPSDGLVALYSIFHIDRRQHGRLLRTLHTLLRDGGPLLVTMGASDWQGTESDFFGAEMSWSHYGPARNREMVENAGFAVLLDEIDLSGGERHQVLLARA